MKIYITPSGPGYGLGGPFGSTVEVTGDAVRGQQLADRGYPTYVVEAELLTRTTTPTFDTTKPTAGPVSIQTPTITNADGVEQEPPADADEANDDAKGWRRGTTKAINHVGEIPPDPEELA